MIRNRRTDDDLRLTAPPAVPPRANAELAWDGHPSRSTVDRLSGKVRWLTMTTHPGLMVAGGDLDLAIQPAGGPWDFAAVMLVVREAGGRCVELSGADVHLPRPPIIYLGGIDPHELRRLSSVDAVHHVCGPCSRCRDGLAGR